MTTIVEFLHARYDEIEATAKTAGLATTDAWALTDSLHISDGTGNDITVTTEPRDDDTYETQTERVDAIVRHMVRHDPEYTLRQAEALRRLVNHMGAFFQPVEIRDDRSRISFDAIKAQYRNLLRYLAVPFAHHPDYDETWRL